MSWFTTVNNSKQPHLPPETAISSDWCLRRFESCHRVARPHRDPARPRSPGGELRALGDLGYEGESDTITVAFKNPRAAGSPWSSSN
jgi:hypothetical protein